MSTCICMPVLHIFVIYAYVYTCVCCMHVYAHVCAVCVFICMRFPALLWHITLITVN